MKKEPNIKFDDLPEGAVVLDKEEKKNFFDSMQEWSAVEWFQAIVGFIVCGIVVIITQEALHISRQWAWAIWMSGFAIFAYIVMQINERKKRRKKKRTGPVESSKVENGRAASRGVASFPLEKIISKVEEKTVLSIKEKLEQRETEDLVEIWDRHDSEEWTPEAFEAIRRILIERRN